MTRSAVARNYGATLWELAAREGGEAPAAWADLLDDLAAAYRDEPDFRRFLDTPRVGLEEKQAVLRRALGEGAPEPFVRFVLVVLEKRRQRALPEIAAAYRELVDEAAGRLRATVTLAHPADEALRTEIVEALERALDSRVTALFREDPSLVGGLVVRVGDRLIDGSIRRGLDRLRRELIRRGGPGLRPASDAQR